MTNATLSAQFIGRDGTTGLWDQIAATPTPELIRRFRFSVGHFDERVFELGDEQLDQAWLPEAGVGRWPVRVLLGHLADAELVLAHRIRRVVAEPGSVVAEWDEDAFIDAGLYAPPGAEDSGDSGDAVNTVPPPPGAFVATIYTLRQWTGEWLSGLAPACWDRRVLHPTRGELSLTDMVRLTTWHVEHHAMFLNAKVERMLGPRPAEGCSPTGCARPGCACGPGKEA